MSNHNLAHVADVAERVDNGRRLAPVECGGSVSAIADYMARRPAPDPEPLPEDTIERVAADVAEALDCLVAARRYLKIDGEKVGATELDAELELAIRDIRNGLVTKLVALKERVS